jgi:RNA polymerase sigma factor (sigma-70 family)
MSEDIWPEEIFTKDFLASPKMLRRYRKVPVQLLAGAGILSLSVATPEETIEKKERAEAVQALLDTLPERERIVLVSCFYEEKTLQEIGQDMGLTPGRVSQIKRKAFRHLRRSARSRLVKKCASIF